MVQPSGGTCAMAAKPMQPPAPRLVDHADPRATEPELQRKSGNMLRNWNLFLAQAPRRRYISCCRGESHTKGKT